MKPSSRPALSRRDFRARQRKVRRCLAQFGLRRGPHRLASRGLGSEGLARRLRRALETLGPVFSSCGLYLASRPDLFSEEDCRELAALRVCALETPYGALLELLRRSLGCDPDIVYSHIEEKPFCYRLLLQFHRARLRSGEWVTVQFVHPELEEYLGCDLKLVSLLEPILGRRIEGAGRLRLAEALDDFRRTLRTEVDLIYQAEACQLLAQEQGSTPVWGVRADLSTSTVLTLQGLEGSALEELPAIRHCLGGPQAPPADDLGAFEAFTHQLCRIWLRQVLAGTLFAAEPRPENVFLLNPNANPTRATTPRPVPWETRRAGPMGEDPCMVFCGGVYASPPPRWQEGLRRYLGAVAAHDPDQALAALLEEMDEAPADGGDELRSRLRRVLPLRDRPGYAPGNDLAEYVLLHWKLTTEGGLRPRPVMLAFFRGLAQIQAMVRRLAPDHDVLLRALEELRVVREREPWSQMVDTDRWGKELRDCVDRLAELPEKLDRALTLAAQGELRVKLQVTPAGNERRGNRTGTGPALLIGAAAVVVGLGWFGEAAPWNDRVGAVALILVGGLVLRILNAGS